MSNFEPCNWCDSARKEGDLERALRCNICGGKGIVPKAEVSICNGCGKSLHPPDKTPNSQIAHGLDNIVLVGGYSSDGLLDLHRYSFSLCETCIRTKIFANCSIPPKVDRAGPGMQGWEPLTFAEDQKSWEYMEWRRTGGHSTARIHRICNAEIDCGKPAKYSVAYSSSVSDDCLCEDHKNRIENCVNASLLPFVQSDWLRDMTKPIEIPPPKDGELVLEFDYQLQNFVEGVTAAMFGTFVKRIVVHTDHEDPNRTPVVLIFDKACSRVQAPTIPNDWKFPELRLHDRTFDRGDKTLIEGWLTAMLCKAADTCRRFEIELRDGWLVNADGHCEMASSDQENT